MRIVQAVPRPPTSLTKISTGERVLLGTFIFLVPLEAVGVFAGGGFIPASVLVATLLLPVSLRVLASGPLPRLLPFSLLFVACAALATLAGSATAPARPLFQFAALIVIVIASSTVAIFATIATANRDWCLQIYMKSALLLAMSALLQAVVANVLRQPQLLDFAWMNSVVGGPVWRYPGTLGPFFRSNGLAPEPAHLAHALLPALALATCRLSLLGVDAKNAVSSILSRRTAVVVVFAYLVSLSLLAIAVAGVLALFLRPTRGLQWRPVVAACLLVTVFSVAAPPLRAAVLEKARTVVIAAELYAGERPSQSVHNSAVSSFAIAANASVTRAVVKRSPLLGLGLGSHAESYREAAPAWLRLLPPALGLNSDDAGTLLLRLLSETGVLGAGTFLVGFVAALRQACIRDPVARVLRTASFVLLLIALARYAVLFWPMLWLFLALATGTYSRKPVGSDRVTA